MTPDSHLLNLALIGDKVSKQRPILSRCFEADELAGVGEWCELLANDILWWLSNRRLSFHPFYTAPLALDT